MSSTAATAVTATTLSSSSLPPFSPPSFPHKKKPSDSKKKNSLYPSIMMAHNLCYSTLLSREAAARLPAAEVLRSPTGDAFARKGLAVGILPEILEELLAARKRAKKDLKEATDPFAKAVLDGRQLVSKKKRDIYV